MTDALIASTARTPIGRAFRGGFNHKKSPTLAAHAIRHAIERARVEPGEAEDVVIGAALPAGLGDSVPGRTIDRQCAAGLFEVL